MLWSRFSTDIGPRTQRDTSSLPPFFLALFSVKTTLYSSSYGISGFTRPFNIRVYSDATEATNANESGNSEDINDKDVRGDVHDGADNCDEV